LGKGFEEEASVVATGELVSGEADFGGMGLCGEARDVSDVVL
jgi:hypothetical protein